MAELELLNPPTFNIDTKNDGPKGKCIETASTIFHQFWVSHVGFGRGRSSVRFLP